MELSGIPFGATDWAYAKKTEHKDESGVANWRTQSFNGISVRMVSTRRATIRPACSAAS
jgi:hypothetical protein